MKILGLIASPRKASNTDLAVTAVLQGATQNKHATDKLYLYDVEIGPCLDCRVCKRGSFQCALKDGMQRVYPLLEEADVLVFGSPLYWYGATAKMKLLVDRLRPYVASKKLAGKKAVLVIPSQEGAQACKSTVEMFKASFDYLGVTVEAVLLPVAYERAEVKKQPETLNAAVEVGRRLR